MFSCTPLAPQFSFFFSFCHTTIDRGRTDKTIIIVFRRRQPIFTADSRTTTTTIITI